MLTWRLLRARIRSISDVTQHYVDDKILDVLRTVCRETWLPRHDNQIRRFLCQLIRRAFLIVKVVARMVVPKCVIEIGPEERTCAINATSEILSRYHVTVYVCH